MKVGRELDALVAEKVMGWEYRGYGNGGGEWTLGDKKMAFGGHGGGSLPHYSTSIDAAWEVVSVLDKCFGKYWSIVRTESEFEFYANPHDAGDYAPYAEAETMSMLLCLATLKAKGVEVTP